MTADQNIQQLTIDRSIKSSPAKFPIILTISISITAIALVSYWLSTDAVAESVNQSPITAKQAKLIAPIGITTNKNKLPELTVSTHSAKIQSVLDASGHIIARRVATVSSRVTGKLEALHIEEGVEVKKSQVIAELDDHQARLSYQLTLAELSAQQASYAELIIIKKYAQQAADRRVQLAESQLISVQLNDDSQLKLAQLSAQIKRSIAQIEQAKQRVELAHYQLAQHKIRAPFNGVVISKNAQVGELISAGSSGGGFIRTGVGTIVDMSSLEIEVEVGESYINRVFAGQQVLATLDAYPKWSIDSEVIAVIPTADRQKASIKVRVKLLNLDARILPDMGVKVSFLAGSVATQVVTRVNEGSENEKS